MNRNKLNIKMDLLRVAKTALDTSVPFNFQLADIFINKAKEEFSMVTDKESALVNDLNNYQIEMQDIVNDSVKRTQWGEKVLTIASRLSSI